MIPKAKSMGGVKRMLPRHSVARKLKIFTALGMAISKVRNMNTEPKKGVHARDEHVVRPHHDGKEGDDH